MEEHIVRAAGTDVHWVEMGAGPPLVLIHGLTDSHRTWSRVAPALAEHHRVLMVDLPGHGLSERPDASYELGWHASVIGAWLEALDLDHADIAGHSFGGGVAQWLLLTHRARVRRLALVSAGGLGREVGWALRLAALPGVVERFGQPWMGPGTRMALHSLGAGFDADDIAASSWMNARPGSARALARTVRDVIDLGGQRRHFLDRAAEVADLPPMSVMWGEADPVIPVAHAAALVRDVEGIALVRFPGVGHFPHRERPAAFVAALNALLDAEAPPTPRLRASRSAGRPLRHVKRRSWFGRAWGSVVARVRRLFTRAPSSRAPRTTHP